MEKLIRSLVLWNWRTVGVTLVAGIGLLAVFRKDLPAEVPLLYSRPWGQDQLVNSWWLWAIPACGLIIGISLTELAKKMSDSPLSAMVLASALVLQLILILGLLRIVLLVV